ncbi:MAG: hypothetical protein M5U34_39385 [Chloroflexi bacterium]|nr:hypothetical protein [Chloroflexota bacterium]
MISTMLSTAPAEIFLDDLTPANLVYSGSAGGGDNSGGGGDTGGGAAGDVGRILYTSGNSLLTTDPAWSTPQEVGTAVSNTCSSPAATNSGELLQSLLRPILQYQRRRRRLRRAQRPGGSGGQ